MLGRNTRAFGARRLGAILLSIGLAAAVTSCSTGRDITTPTAVPTGAVIAKARSHDPRTIATVLPLKDLNDKTANLAVGVSFGGWNSYFSDDKPGAESVTSKAEFYATVTDTSLEPTLSMFGTLIASALYPASSVPCKILGADDAGGQTRPYLTKDKKYCAVQIGDLVLTTDLTRGSSFTASRRVSDPDAGLTMLHQPKAQLSAVEAAVDRPAAIIIQLDSEANLSDESAVQTLVPDWTAVTSPHCELTTGRAFYPMQVIASSRTISCEKTNG